VLIKSREVIITPNRLLNFIVGAVKKSLPEPPHCCPLKNHCWNRPIAIKARGHQQRLRQSSLATIAPPSLINHGIAT
jgi:hypothetical protein